jgi:putative Holliday junction resolvase
MDGSRGDSSSKVQYLAGLIEKDTGLPVILFDERCTTMLAHKILNATDTRGAKRKNVVDTLSAQIILQNYLDTKK